MRKTFPGATRKTTPNSTHVKSLLRRIARIRVGVISAELACAPLIEEAHPAQRTSARNLLHYAVLRRHGSGNLNERLSSFGLLPLTNTRRPILENIDRAISLLKSLSEVTHSEDEDRRGIAEPPAQREDAASPLPKKQHLVMLTLSGESSTDIDFIARLLRAGMNVLRINCARDNAGVWEGLIASLRSAERITGRKCKLFMDLAGPKLRTGSLSECQGVVKWSPRRDRFGRVVAPARIHFVAGDTKKETEPGVDVSLTMPATWLLRRKVGEVLKFVDARGSKRSVRLTAIRRTGVIGESTSTAYLTSGVRLRVSTEKGSIALRGLPPATEEVRVRVGEILWLTASPIPGIAANVNEGGRVILPARIGVTLPEVLADVKRGERVWIDDGKIGGVVRGRGKGRLEVEITHAAERGTKVRADRSINLPDSKLRISSLTSKDIRDLEFVALHADWIGYSFIRTPEDVHELLLRLGHFPRKGIGVVLKVENRKAYERLPEILLAGMRTRNVAALIARGDLAVECGFVETPRIQEEIFSACEAARMPVFIATQVLESLAQKGVLSRPEMVDAHVAARADCIMLNKGPHVLEALRTIKAIVRECEAAVKT